MSDHTTTRRRGAWVSVLVTSVLSAASAVTVCFGIYRALHRQDTEPVESPLVLALSRQLTHGPWEFYGPFGGENHWVIIHAPLYYRLAALLAWPLVRLGIDPVTAALAAGRSLSFVGLAGTLAAAYRIARLDGAPVTAGTWAALLIAASLVVDVMPYTVRPDMVGIALNLTGVLLVLSVLRAERPGAPSCRRLTRRLGWPYVPSNISSWPPSSALFCCCPPAFAAGCRPGTSSLVGRPASPSC